MDLGGPYWLGIVPCIRRPQAAMLVATAVTGGNAGEGTAYASQLAMNGQGSHVGGCIFGMVGSSTPCHHAMIKDARRH